MASTISRVEILKTDFQFSIPNISTFDRISTETVLMRGLPWRIEVRRYGSNDDGSIGIGLFCEHGDDSSNFSCAATATIKILSFNRSQPAYERILDPCIFDAQRNSRILKTFIKWHDLMDATQFFVNDDTIVLDIVLKSGALNTINESNSLSFIAMDNCCENAAIAKYRMIVHKISDLMVVRSPIFKVRNMPSEIYISKISASNGDYLKIALCCKHIDTTNKWSCEMTLSVSLARKDMDPYKRDIGSFIICGEKRSFELKKFLLWHQLTDSTNGFIDNDAIYFDIEIKTEKPIGVPPKPRDRHINAAPYELKCQICSRNMLGKIVTTTPCSHLFCTVCIEESIEKRKKCPICYHKIKPKKLQTVSLYR